MHIFKDLVGSFQTKDAPDGLRQKEKVRLPECKPVRQGVRVYQGLTETGAVTLLKQCPHVRNSSGTCAGSLVRRRPGPRGLFLPSHFVASLCRAERGASHHGDLDGTVLLVRDQIQLFFQ